jgi:hypothetical protein
MPVNSLGDEFEPAMRAGWLAYIRKNYPDEAAAAVELCIYMFMNL